GYVNKLNELLKDTDLEQESLEDIIKKTVRAFDKKTIYNNAAQVYNHTFYWNCMKKDGGGKPSEPLLKKIEQDFGSFETFVEQFKKAGATLFGSGWVWLVLDKGSLKIVQTSNANCPLSDGQKPLLTMDVWEHAYYLDYQNARTKYIDAFMDHLVNWEFVEKNFEHDGPNK
ncbi:MAG: superoxide dismutase, partial [bacterium]